MKIKSHYLEGNLMGDPVLRTNHVLIPKGLDLKKPTPVIFILPAFGSSASKEVADIPFKTNLLDLIQGGLKKNKFPKALYVVVSADTSLGGSQYIDSYMGSYGSYFVKELYEEVKTLACVDLDRVGILGTSSGGYGALELASRHPKKFPFACAVAPDSFFEGSLLPEIRFALPWIKKLGGTQSVLKLFRQRKTSKIPHLHHIANAMAMGFCYAGGKQSVEWPINDEGVVITKSWKKWLIHDPIYFLKRRKKAVQSLRGVYLSVGSEDQFHLQYGARQIKSLLKELLGSRFGSVVTYKEFSGNHFGLKEDFPVALEWLKKRWQEN